MLRRIKKLLIGCPFGGELFHKLFLSDDLKNDEPVLYSTLPAPLLSTKLPLVPEPAQPRFIWRGKVSKGGNDCHQRRDRRETSRAVQSEELGGAAKKINGPRTSNEQEHHAVSNGEAARGR